MSFLFKNLNLISLFFICCVFTLFMNCAGMDTPIENLTSQTENQQENNKANNGSNSNNTEQNDNDNDNDNSYNFSERSESPPILKHIIDQLAQQCPDQVGALSDGTNWTGNLDFLDLLVEALRREDKRWGYTFWDGDIWSSDLIGYYRGVGDPNGSNDIAILDYTNKITVPNVHWSIEAYEKIKEYHPNSEGQWRYPRPGATVSLSDCSGNSNGNNNNNNNIVASCGSAAGFAGYGGYGSDGQEGTSDDPHIYSTSVNSCGELEAFGHDDWEDFTFQTTSSSISQSNDQVREVVESGGVCCVRDTGTTTTTITATTNSSTTALGQCDVPNHFSVIQQVAKDYPDLLAISNDKSAKDWQLLEKIVEELRKIDTKWGFYHRTQHNLQEASLDAVAYYCGTGDGNGSSDLRFVDIIVGSIPRSIAWQDSKEGHADRAKPENGYWKYPR